MGQLETSFWVVHVADGILWNAQLWYVRLYQHSLNNVSAYQTTSCSSWLLYDFRLLYDTNSKCIATNVLAKLNFQEYTDQKSGLFQDQQDFYRPNFFSLSGLFGPFQGPVGTLCD